MSLNRSDFPADPQDMAIIEKLLIAARSGAGYRIEKSDIWALRAASEKMIASPVMTQPDPRVRIGAGSVGGIAGEWLTPPEVTEQAVIVFLCGGGYVRGSLALGRPTASEIAVRTGARVFTPAVRQGPEDPFPAAYVDVLTVARALGRDGMPFVLTGESAGGGLAVAVTLGLRDAGAEQPCCTAAISPFLDLTLSGDSWRFNDGKDVASRKMGESMIALYLNNANPRDVRASPVFGEFHNICPLHITIGSHEGLYSEALRVAEKADAAGAEVQLDVWEGMVHGLSKVRLHAAAGAAERISAWIKARIQMCGAESIPPRVL